MKKFGNIFGVTCLYWLGSYRSGGTGFGNVVSQSAAFAD